MSRNNSATGGFLLPNPKAPELTTVPPGLTFIQFIQQLLVGLSGLNGPLVRPQWQKEPPKQPDIDVNWMAFGLGQATADNNAVIGLDAEDNPTLQRNEEVPIIISMYGPDAYDLLGQVRDGFQLTQNLTTLRRAKIGFAYDTPMLHVPDFFNERWFERWRMEIHIRRLIIRSYPILTFTSANGTIYTQTAEDINYELPYAASGE